MSAHNYWDEFVWVVESKGKELIEFPTKEEAMESLPQYTWDNWSNTHDEKYIYKVAWQKGTPVQNPEDHPIIRSKRKGS